MVLCLRKGSSTFPNLFTNGSKHFLCSDIATHQRSRLAGTSLSQNILRSLRIFRKFLPSPQDRAFDLSSSQFFLQQISSKPAFLFHLANNEDELTILRAATIKQKTVQAGNSFMVFRNDEKVWTLIVRRTFYSSVLFLNTFGDLLKFESTGES